MKSFPFKKVDAFATPTSAGNPAGIIRLESFDAVTEPQMQRIARELQGFVCEVGFIARIAPDAFKVRFFASEKEVPFCGHATIGIGFDCFSNEPDLAALGRIDLHTIKGIVPVENRIREEQAVYLHAPAPVHTQCRIALPEICKALGISESSVDPQIPLGLVNAGNETLCVAMKTAGGVVGARPEFSRLLSFCQVHQLDTVTIFSRDVADLANHLRTRVFTPPFGYLEDPATGSANAALGYHLHRTGHWGGQPIRIEQNAELANPNLVRLASVADAQFGIRTLIGGGSVLKIEGSYWI